MLEDLAGRHAGLGGDRGGHGRAGGDPDEGASERDRADLRRRGEHDLPPARPAREQAPSLCRQPAAQADRGDEGEPEQERAQLSADQDEAVRRDLASVFHVEERRVRPAQSHRRVGRDRRLGPRLVREHAVDVPGAKPAERERRDPRVDPVERLQRPEPLQRLDARCEQQPGARTVRGRRGGDVTEDARVSQAGDADPAQPHVVFRKMREPASPDLEHLAARGVARPRQPPRTETHDRREVVRGRDLDQLAVHAQLPKEDDSPDLARPERNERAAGTPVGGDVAAGVERRAEAVDPEAAGALGRRRERPPERLLPCDEAPAEDGHEHRERERDPGDEQGRAQGLRAQPRGGDGERRLDFAHRHRSLETTGVAN